MTTNGQDIKFPELPHNIGAANCSDKITLTAAELVHMLQLYAFEALQMNQQAPAQATAERRPFDLEAAKQGEPLVTRDGRSAKFVAYVPEAGEMYRVLALIEEHAVPTFYNESGAYYDNSRHQSDLFMAPKPKRTVWVNFYRTPGFDAELRSATFESEETAQRFAYGPNLVVAAVPVEIEYQGAK